jgi:hypothetical protein
LLLAHVSGEKKKAPLTIFAVCNTTHRHHQEALDAAGPTKEKTFD